MFELSLFFPRAVYVFLQKVRCAGTWVMHSPGCQIALCFLVPAAVGLSLYQAKQHNFTVVTVPAISGAKPVETQWGIDRLRFEHGQYEIEGWVTDLPHSFSWLKPRVVLVPPDQNQGVSVRTRMVPRPDISAALGYDGELHFSGFRATFLPRYVPVVPGARVFISVEHKGQRVLIDTGHTLPAAS